MSNKTNYLNELKLIKKEMMEKKVADDLETKKKIRSIFNTIVQITNDKEFLEVINSFRSSHTNKYVTTLVMKYTTESSRCISSKDRTYLLDWLLSRMFTVSGVTL